MTFKKDFLDVELDREKTRTSAPERAVHIIPYDMDFTPTVLTSRDDMFLNVPGILAENGLKYSTEDILAAMTIYKELNRK